MIAKKLTVYEVLIKREIDESYFGGKRKGKRGRGATEKTIVLRLYKRSDHVHTLTISNTTTCNSIVSYRKNSSSE